MIEAHSEHVGSLLRPPELLCARAQRDRGEIAAERLRAIEDAAIDRVLALQEGAGCEIVTDGEFRRLSFQSVLVEGTTGFGEWDLAAYLWGDWYGDGLEPWHRPCPANLGVTGRLARLRHLAAEEFAYMRHRTDRTIKVTLPSPSLLANFWSPARSRSVYPTLDEFLDAVLGLVKDEVAALVGLGCSYVQLDAPHYPLMLDPATRASYESRGWNREEWLGRGVELDNAVIDAFPDLTFGMHLCRGNQGSRWLCAGGYEPIAAHVFGRVHAHRVLLEYDDARSGDFAPLRHLPRDKIAVLGLVTTKTDRMEDPSALRGRILEASRYVELERLALSPQCGFSTSVVGNRISEECEMAKLRLITDLAREIWP